MALDFGLLQPANISGQLQAGQESAMRNQLAQQQLASSQQQMETGRLQQEKAGLEIQQFKRRQSALDKFLIDAEKGGHTGDPEDVAKSFYDFAITSGEPQVVLAAQQALMAAKERKQYIAGRTPKTPAAPAVTAPNALVSTMQLGALGSGTFGMVPEPANQLTPTAPTPTANAMVGPNIKALENEIFRLETQFANVPAAQKEVARLTKQLDKLQGLHVINNKLVSGAGDVMYTGDLPATETSRLIDERQKLINSGVLPTDPRVLAFDQKLASGESQTAKLMRERQIAIASGAPSSVIAQYDRDIRNLHPGLAMQNVVGVDSTGNQVVTRFPGAGGAPSGTFTLNQAPLGTARAMLGLSEDDSNLLFGPNGPVETGQIPVNKLNAANAKLYVAAMKANPSLNLTNLTENQLSAAAKAKATGNIAGRQTLTTVDQETAKNIANGNLPPLTGPGSTKIMNQVMEINPNFKADDYKLQTAAVKAFNQGIQGNKVRSLNVVMDHFNTLEKAADALESGDVRLINTVSQFIQTQTGKPAPSNFNAVKEILADEIVAAVVPGVGALADRQAIKRTILAASSPEQIKGIVANYKELIGGQLNGLEQQYKAGTGRNDFKTRYLTPAAVANLTPQSQYAEIKTLPDGRKLGKKADGTIEEIK